MNFEGKRVGFGLTGSHCTYGVVVPEIEKLVSLGAEVVPVVSYTVKSTDTKFGDGADWLAKIEKAAGRKAIDSIVDAEPLGPREPLDVMVIAPLTGNSMSKFANGLTDSAVLMAAKATLRNSKPVVLGISTNDALGLNGINLMKLMGAKNVYFIPFGQDDPVLKPTSMVSRMDLIPETVDAALNNKQFQPVIIERGKNN